MSKTECAILAGRHLKVADVVVGDAVAAADRVQVGRTNFQAFLT